ncbi:STAS domain-containing protein [Gordonia pseudamarae]|mgnify:CR=1 FL=1|uniref:STAS domain-containing protein n=1 Tax=Gordonia pseudamarae TaxID=2831662 RepID=A0ABX6IN60_9ACTN|nr:SulP family inorganic anion transporter [Gordonia sp. (in: high G+C Gram-positive bacteria)]QHN28331.1 STAS domain-containing protein [Gordonia pseudamarae]QHN37200.1 STAS domain-containing protein [Gordonia pseudamarae]
MSEDNRSGPAFGKPGSRVRDLLDRGLLNSLTPPSLVGYRVRWLGRDVLAGVTLAAIAIPECLGYGAIAQVPVVAGLYTIILPAIVFALVGSSRLMVVGADSATAALLSSGIAGLGVAGLRAGSDQWLQWACLIALVTGVMLFAAWILRLGFLGDFLSTAVLTGFLTGTAITVMTGQLPTMLGIPDGHADQIWNRWWEIVRAIDDIDWWDALLAAISLLVLVAGRRIAPRLPIPFVLVTTAIALVWIFGWGEEVAVVGKVDAGLPELGPPDGLGLSDAVTAVSIAFGCTIVILAQSAATARGFAQRRGESADVNRDILGLAGANVTAGLSGGFVVNGSPTKTEVLDEQRAHSQVANLTMAAATLLVVTLLSDALAHLPHAVLGAIVFVVAAKLIDVREFVRIGRVRRSELAIAVFAAVVVIVFGVQTGIVAAMTVSLLALIRRQYRPERFVIGVNDRGTRSFLPARPGLQSLPGLIIFRYDADLFYANASRFSEDVQSLLRSAPTPVRWLVLDCTAIGDVDYSASTMLGSLIDYVHSHGAHFVLAGVDPELQSALLTEGVLAGLDPDHVYASVGAAVRAYRSLDGEDDEAAGQEGP